MRELADILGVTPEWLLQGNEPKLNAKSQASQEQIVRSLLLPKGGGRKANPASVVTPDVFWIPLISWAQAGMATAFEEIPEHWQEKIPATVSDKSAFAIQLRGDSMEPKYSDGDIAVVLPHASSRNGDLVVANIKEEGFAFKVMTLIGGDIRHIRLTSYNQVYPPMDFQREQFHWIYPVHSVNKLVRRS